MSPIEEAVRLLKAQPEENVRIIVELLRTMQNPRRPESAEKRFGAGRDEIRLPENFFEHFDDANDEIAGMFYGGE
jgi:hypothetical protein